MTPTYTTEPLGEPVINKTVRVDPRRYIPITTHEQPNGTRLYVVGAVDNNGTLLPRPEVMRYLSPDKARERASWLYQHWHIYRKQWS